MRARVPAVTGRRLWFVGIGGAGSRAYAQLARAWGAEVGGWDRVRTPYLEPLDGRARSRSRPSRSCPTAGRRSSRPRTRACPGCGARSSSPSSSRLRRVDRRRRHARQGDDGGDDRVRPARDRARPRLADRRAGAAARLERGLRGGLARRRGRRVGPHGLRAAGRDRGRHERRARPPHRVRVARPSSRTRSSAGSSARRTSCATRRRSTASSRCRASTTGATPARRSPRSSSRACRATRPSRRSRRFTGHGPALRGPRGRRRDDRRRLRPPPDRDRRDDRRRARALSRARACACSSSRTSTRARGTSRRELAAALAAADDVTVTDVYPAREQPLPGVTGKLVVDALERPRRARRLDSDASRTARHG